jgi:hypothetical protein
MNSMLMKPEEDMDLSVATLTHLTRSAKMKTAGSLALAFEEYPMMKYVFPDDAKRVSSLEALFQGCVRGSYLAGGVVAASPADDSGIPGGAVCWLSAGQFPIKPGLLLSSGMILTPLRIGLDAYKRLETQEHEAEVKIDERYSGSNMAYLWLIGTSPAARGRGLGRRLIDVTLKSMKDKGHELCVLKTDTSENVGFYEYLGFSVTESGVSGGSGIPYWILEKTL